MTLPNMAEGKEFYCSSDGEYSQRQLEEEREGRQSTSRNTAMKERGWGKQARHTKEDHESTRPHGCNGRVIQEGEAGVRESHELKKFKAAAGRRAEKSQKKLYY